MPIFLQRNHMLLLCIPFDEEEDTDTCDIVFGASPH